MEHERIWQKANHLLQIPPYLEPRTEINEVLSDDRDLDGFDIHHSKFVFTDISFDIINEVAFHLFLKTL